MVIAQHWIDNVKRFGDMAVCQLINNAMTNLTQRVLLMDTVAKTQTVTTKNASLSMYISKAQRRKENVTFLSITFFLNADILFFDFSHSISLQKK